MSERENAGRVSHEAVQAKTGKTWEEWFTLLDAAGAEKMNHKQIVAFLADHEIGGWWQQMVTVTYEKARGMRATHEKPSGYEIGRSKTVPVPRDVLFDAWEDAASRARWLEAGSLEVHRTTRPKTMRGRWTEDDSRVDVYFTEKGAGRSQVAVQHGRLASASDAERMKAFWAEQLNRLARFLTAPAERNDA